MKEFKAFIMRGNVIDMAVGIIIGAAFGAIVTSLVRDVIMPPVGLALGKIDFSNLAIFLKQPTTPGTYNTIAEAQAAGAVTLNYGLFVNTIITFIIIALIVFFGIVRPIMRMKAKEVPAPVVPTTKDCPFCYTAIPIKATRCPNCTSPLTK